MIVILQANDCGAKIHKKLYTAMLVIIYFVEESIKKQGILYFSIRATRAVGKVLLSYCL